MTDTIDSNSLGNALKIRRASPADLDQVIDLDAHTTGQVKPEYWKDIFERYGSRRLAGRFILVAQPAKDSPIIGLIVGEVREWEFGSEQCGWVFAISVAPDWRQQKVGTALFNAICDNFQEVGISKIRTMTRRDNPLHMSFFRGEGMVAGPFIQLELNLDED